MSYKFNPFTGNFDEAGSGGGAQYIQPPVATEAILPTSGNTDGDAVVTLDTDIVWVWDGTTSRWKNTGVKASNVGSTPNAQAYTFESVNVGANRTEIQLQLQPANATNPGILTAGTQTIGGDKTFQDDVVVSGDLTVNGTTTTINTTNLEVTDKNITINNGGNDVSAEGAGLTVERTGTNGSLIYEDALASKFKAGAAGSEIELANVSSAQALTNKTIDADSNTITNIENADIKAAAAIDASKIADGTVSNTEFQYINSLTSNVQTQINDHLGDTTDAHDASSISNVPSGNLVATDVQSALDELQTELDNTANKFLSNLDTPTAVNQHLNPGSNGLLDLGTSSTNKWRSLFLQNAIDISGTNGDISIRDSGTSQLFINMRQVQTSPTTGVTGSGIMVYDSRAGIFATADNSTANATATGSVLLESGDKTAGTGNSGNIDLRTGTSIGGTRGSISLNSSQLNVTLPNNGLVVVNGSPTTLRGGSSTSLVLGTSAIPTGSSYFRSQNTPGAIIIQTQISTNEVLMLHGDLTTPTGLNRGANVYNPYAETDQSGRGNLILFTAQNTSSTAAQVGGAIFLETGNRVTGTLNAVSGAFRAQTGTSSNGTSGALSLISGTGTNTGVINLTSGNATGNSGNVNLTTGTAGGTRGEISLNGRQINANTTKIVNVVDPTAAQDAATKNYVDNAIPAAPITPTWVKFSSISQSLFTAAANTEDIELFSLPAKGVIHNVIIKHSASFTGGTISAFDLSVGISGNLTKYASAFDVFQAPGATVSQTSTSVDVEDFVSATSIRLAATSVGDTVDNATAGLVDVYVLYGILP